MSDVSWLVRLHLCAALAATLLGPLVLWTRLPSLASRWRRCHRLGGRVWVLLMLIASLSALGIQSSGHFSWLHLLIPLTLWGLWSGLRAIARGQVQRHRQSMISVYIGACVVAGLFTLLPDRLLGRWFWGHFAQAEPPAAWVLWQWAWHHPERLPQILAQTPLAVWGLLGVLAALGLTQLRNHWCSTSRLLGRGLGLMGASGLSLWSVLQASPWHPAGLICWLALSALCVLWQFQRAKALPMPSTLRYDAERSRVLLPGSVWPLVTFFALFACHYLVRVELALRQTALPDLALALVIVMGSSLSTAVLLTRLVRYGVWLQRQRASLQLSAMTS